MRIASPAIPLTAARRRGTELGQELAARGHDVHFISYAPPIRMNLNDPHIFFHEVEVASYRCSITRRMPWRGDQMLKYFEAQSLDLLHVHYAIPHSVSAMLGARWARPEAARLSPPA